MMEGLGLLCFGLSSAETDFLWLEDEQYRLPALLLVGEQQKKWYQQILQKVQNLVPHDDYIKSCTVYTVVQQYVCVCVFSSHSFWTSSSLDVLAGVTKV